MKYKKVYCKDCRKLLNKKAYYFGHKRCLSCARKFLLKNPKNNPMYGKKGSLSPLWRENIHLPLYCVDCGTILNKRAYYFKNKRCASCAKKNKQNSMYDTKHTLKTRKKMSKIAKKLFKNPKRRKIFRKGFEKKFNKYTKIYPMSGKKHSLETKTKMSKAQIGEKGNNWQGGKSFEIYPQEFNKINKELIRMRDKYKCQLCGCLQVEYRRALDVHHIDYNKKNNDHKNHITLCNRCNVKVNTKRKYWEQYFKKLIKEKYNNASTDLLCRIKS